MKIRDLLQKNSIIMDLQGSSKNEILTQMARYMVSLHNLSNADYVARKILEREAEMSTGIGFGIAIPHARIDKVDRLYMIAGRSINGIPFDSIDEELVHLIFMMISPPNTSTDHTYILSSLSRIMSYEEMRKRLFAANKAELFLDLMIKGEDRYVE